MLQQLIAKYKPSFKSDLTGGMLAAIIGLPMGLAFGVQSGLGPQAGIYTAIILAIVGAFFGGTRTLISDPTGPMTVVGATVVSMGISQAGSVENAWPLIVATFMLAGIFELIFGILDFGKYVKYLPYPVLSGFMAGIGVIIISVQVFPLLGHESPSGFVSIWSSIGQPLANLNSEALLLGLGTICVVYLLPLITKKIPSILAALILGTLVAVFFELDVPVIGEIPREFPKIHLTDVLGLHLSDLEYIITPALILGSLGVIDSLLTSVVADNLTKTKHNSKWTVIGQGVGNLVTAIFGGIPGAGATMGTVTNIKSGAQTRVSGISKGVFLLLIVVGIAEYVQFIPMAVLAGILITIGVGIIDYRGIKMLRKVPRADAITWVIVLLVTLFDNLLDAVAVGFILSAVLFIGKMSTALNNSVHTEVLGKLVKRKTLPVDLADKIHVKSIDGPLFFGFADRFREHCYNIDDVIGVIMRLENIPFLDQSGLVVLEDAIVNWHDRGIQVYITCKDPRSFEMFEKTDLVPRVVKRSYCFTNFDSCVQAIRNRIDENRTAGVAEDLLLTEPE